MRFMVKNRTIRLSSEKALRTKQRLRQYALVKKYYPDFRVKQTPFSLTIHASMCPGVGCDNYDIEIQMGNCHPWVKCYIKTPKITPSIQYHMYTKDGRLCLYHPTECPWKAHYNLHDTIIPWIAEWLIFYEIFKLKGIWLGKEHPHKSKEKQS